VERQLLELHQQLGLEHRVGFYERLDLEHWVGVDKLVDRRARLGYSLSGGRVRAGDAAVPG
jgi:hypothetical protein